MLQYLSQDGADSNNGLSWATAKATLEAAVGDIKPPGYPRGGQIKVGAGSFPVHELDVDKQVRITGLSPKATTLVPQDGWGVKLTAPMASIEHLRFALEGIPGGYPPFNGRAVWIASDYSNYLDDVWFHQLGRDYAASTDIDVAPACVYVQAEADFTDWHKFSRLKIGSCYRGVVHGGSGNFVLSASDIVTVAESLFILRRSLAESDPGGGVQADKLRLGHATSPITDTYRVRLEVDVDAPNATMAVTLNNNITETRNGKHIYCGGDRNTVLGHRFIGNGEAVYFEEGTSKNIVGEHQLVPGWGGTPAMAGDLTNNHIGLGV